MSRFLPRARRDRRELRDNPAIQAHDRAEIEQMEMKDRSLSPKAKLSRPIASMRIIRQLLVPHPQVLQDGLHSQFGQILEGKVHPQDFRLEQADFGHFRLRLCRRMVKSSRRQACAPGRNVLSDISVEISRPTSDIFCEIDQVSVWTNARPGAYSCGMAYGHFFGHDLAALICIPAWRRASCHYAVSDRSCSSRW